MEEWIGQQWHRLVSRAADRSHAHARVSLSEMERAIGLLFRAGGGSETVRLTRSSRTRVGGARGLLQRMAGSDTHADLPQLDGETLALPAELAVFDDVALNRALYLWLAALAASAPVSSGDWLRDNLLASRTALQRFPGLRERHARLVEAQLALRPPLDLLKGPARQAEAQVCRTLRAGVDGTPSAWDGGMSIHPQDVAPVWLWLQSCPDRSQTASARTPSEEEPPPGSPRPAAADRRRRHAETVSDERNRAPLMMFFRAESILSWGEFVKVNRASDDDPDENAAKVADDMDVLSVAPDGETAASRVKFDLDLPSAAADDRPLGPGLRLPEWDHRKARLLPEHCAVQCRIATPGERFVPPVALRATARRVRRRLEVLRAAPRRARARTEGDELDLDAWVRHSAEGSGQGVTRSEAPPVFTRLERTERSLATLLLADLSLSTDAHIWTTPSRRSAEAGHTGSTRVIDVIRDALYVFGEALHAGGDPFEMLGFSSVRRQNVRIQHLKGFDEAWSEPARQRVGAIKPGYYTRMGAALRYATLRLAERPERQRLLLILTDGKPNDLDVYEGRYGLEDTRHAVQAARDAGLTPFCVTIDEDAPDYLPMLFGQHGWALVHRPQDLVHRLAQVYAGLTAR